MSYRTVGKSFQMPEVKCWMIWTFFWWLRCDNLAWRYRWLSTIGCWEFERCIYKKIRSDLFCVVARYDGWSVELGMLPQYYWAPLVDRILNDNSGNIVKEFTALLSHMKNLDIYQIAYRPILSARFIAQGEGGHLFVLIKANKSN